MHSAKIQTEHRDLDLKRGLKEMLCRASKWAMAGRLCRLSLPLKAFASSVASPPLLYMPMMKAAGDKIYNRVAERRYCILQPLI